MDGYHRLAAVQTAHPELAIYRRHLHLHSLDLLRLQAEIAYLQDDLGSQLTTDRVSGDPTRAGYEFDFASLHSSINPSKPEQLKLLDELRIKLKEHAETLLRHAALRRLPLASHENQTQLRHWLLDEEGGHDSFHSIEGLIYETIHADDLVSLSPPPKNEEDKLTRFINQSILPLYHQFFGHRHKQQSTIIDPFGPGKELPTPIWRYRDSTVAAVVNGCSTILASIIPALGALGLFYIKSAEARMGAIVGLTSVFSVVVALVAGAGRAECFVATSAFAAVLVVFVGGDGGVCAC